MNCTICGTNLPDNSAFCPHCGRAVQPATTTMYEQPIQAQPQTSVFEQPTQSEIPTYQQPNYAQPVYGQTAYTQPAYGHPVPPKKKSKAPWIALGVSLFLLIGIIALVIVLLVSCSGTDNSSPDAVVNSYFKAIAEDEAEDCIDAVYPPLISSYTSTGISEDVVYYMLRSDALDSFSASTVKFTNLVITERIQMDNDEIADGNSEMSQLPDYIPMTSGVLLKGTITASFNGIQTPEDLEWSAGIVCADGEYYIVEFALYY